MYIHNMICKLDPIPESRHQYGELISKFERDEISDLNDVNARKNDIKIFTDKKIRKLYMSKNDPNSINKFEFVLVNYENGNAREKLEVKNSLKLPTKKSGITRVIFYGNWAKEFYPFTRWILAHRSYHALNVTFEKCIESFNDTVIQFINKIAEVLGYTDEVTNLIRIKDPLLYGNLDQKSKVIEEIRSVFKFRSAKHSDRLIDIDLFAELFAQYQITGSISFNKTDNDDINNLIDEYTPILNEKVITVCHQMNNKELIF